MEWKECTIQEAAEAHVEGKTIKVEFTNFNFRGEKVTDVYEKNDDTDITTWMIHTGKWFVGIEPEETDFRGAIKAWKEGKTISPYKNIDILRYNRKNKTKEQINSYVIPVDNTGMPMGHQEMLKEKWYILD